MSETIFDLIVIGGGPAGYTGAIRAAQLGQRVAIIERETELGGTCLRIGCIPSKALLESSARFEEAKSHLEVHGIRSKGVTLDLPVMLKRKDSVVGALTTGVRGLMKKNKIEHVNGHATLTGKADGGWGIEVSGAASQKMVAKKILIATGSTESPLPGVTVDGKQVVTSTEALSFAEVPKHLVVIGAGAIGLELGSVWRRLGAKVTVLEYAARILPTMDAELAVAAGKIFAKQGLQIRTSTKVTGVAVSGKSVKVSVDGSDDIACDKVLLAVGRRPNTEKLGLDSVGIALDKRGRIPVNGHYETSAAGIFACGDVIEGPMLAHKAEEEAVACVEQMQIGFGHVNYEAIGYIVYTEPEVASVGQTEEQLKEAGRSYRKGSFPFMANGRARAIAATDGFVKILADDKTDRVLGAHIVGAHAGDLIQEVATAINFGASSEDIARTCHAHPTLSEAVREAALAVDKRTINL